MKVYIYCLIDPLTNQLKYIGKTVNPTKRYSSHLNEIKKDKKSTWVQSLKNNGTNPEFLILDICEENEWIF